MMGRAIARRLKDQCTQLVNDQRNMIIIVISILVRLSITIIQYSQAFIIPFVQRKMTKQHHRITITKQQAHGRATGLKINTMFPCITYTNHFISILRLTGKINRKMRWAYQGFPDADFGLEPETHLLISSTDANNQI